MVPNTRVNTQKERSTEEAHLPLLTAVFIQETSFRMKYQARVDMFGQMERPMKVNGRRTKCMDTAL